MSDDRILVNCPALKVVNKVQNTITLGESGTFIGGSASKGCVGAKTVGYMGTKGTLSLSLAVDCTVQKLLIYKGMVKQDFISVAKYRKNLATYGNKVDAITAQMQLLHDEQTLGMSEADFDAACNTIAQDIQVIQGKASQMSALRNDIYKKVTECQAIAANTYGTQSKICKKLNVAAATMVESTITTTVTVEQVNEVGTVLNHAAGVTIIN